MGITTWAPVRAPHIDLAVVLRLRIKMQLGHLSRANPIAGLRRVELLLGPRQLQESILKAHGDRLRLARDARR